MSAHCCHDAVCPTASADPRWRQALWVALLLNAAMFVVELGAAWRSGSVSLLADSIDFFGDAGNYAISLAVLGMGLAARARAALFKAAGMAALDQAAFMAVFFHSIILAVNLDEAAV